MPVDNLAVDDQWPLINFQLVMEGKEGEIRTNNIDSLHSDSLVHSQKENSKVGFGGNNEFMAPGLFFDFSMGEADLITVEDKALPKISIGKCIQILHGKVMFRWAKPMKIKGCTGGKK